MRRLLLGLLLALLPMPSAVAGDGPVPAAPAADVPRTPQEAADAVVEAFQAKDTARLALLAALDVPDPWLVADELCLRKRADAAKAYSGAAPRVDVEGLPAYVASRADGPSTLGPVAEAFVEGESRLGEGRLRAATDAFLRSAAAAADLGWVSAACKALRAAGGAAMDAGDLGVADDAWARRLVLEEKRGHPEGIARACANLGLIRRQRGDLTRAFELELRALEGARKLGIRVLEGVVLLNLGGIHLLAKDHGRADALMKEARAIGADLGDDGLAAMALANLGLNAWSEGQHGDALGYYARALAIFEKTGDGRSVEITRVNVALALRDSGRTGEALTILEETLAVYERAEDRVGVVTTLGSIAALHYLVGDHAKAVEAGRRAVGLAHEIGDLDTEAVRLGGMAGALLQLGRNEEAAAAAAQSITLSAQISSGLADEQAARAREAMDGPAVFGFYAARQLRDPARAWWFLEIARAGALAESLQARETLRDAVIPAALRDAEAEAQEAYARAMETWRAATESGDLRGVVAARASRDAARTRIQEVVERIQRTAKSGASLVHPRPDTLLDVQSALRAGETLVAYVVRHGEAAAMVVSAADARIVPLRATREVEAACAALVAQERATDPAPAVDALRELVIDPLGLDEKTTRVLVSPDGPLTYVPFALLVGAREVTYIPSGTTYRLLLSDASARGAGVLALGDPEYRASQAPRGFAVLRGGHDLARLPGTAREAKSVGDVAITGRDATEARLREELAKRSRWRAVHLACHGLIDPQRPMFSSLALTPAGEDDGFLTALEVFRMKVPADLVVLSACETGKGKVYRAEGIVGLTRAFMFAGAPRVLVSLWRVDDAATAALMTKLYELWNPKAGKGLPLARALREAQEFVRSQERWRHPAYWAAWVLWGLPE